MEIEQLFETYDKSKHELSKESLEKTKDIVEKYKNNIRLRYDQFKIMQKDSDWIKTTSKLIEQGQAKNMKQATEHMVRLTTRLLVNELPEDFVNLLNVE